MEHLEFDLKNTIKDSISTILTVLASELKSQAIMGRVKDLQTETKKTPVYTVGSADPRTIVRTEVPNRPSEFTREYTSFSGCDVKVIFEDEKGKEGIGTIQGFWYKKSIVGNHVILTGEVSRILFSGEEEEWLGKEVRMLAVAANEYGAISVVFDEQIQFTEKVYGISVDDTISEEIYTFAGTKVENLTNHTERLKNQFSDYKKEKKAEHVALIKELRTKACCNE